MGMKKNIEPYYVLGWDVNRGRIENYNIMPYLLRCWDEEKKRKRKIWDYDNEEHKHKMPETFDEFKHFILKNSQYQFWARCEYEIIIQDWPCKKHEEKIDIYYQIEMNIDVITNHFMKQVQ